MNTRLLRCITRAKPSCVKWHQLRDAAFGHVPDFVDVRGQRINLSVPMAHYNYPGTNLQLSYHSLNTKIIGLPLDVVRKLEDIVRIHNMRFGYLMIQR